MRLPPAPSVQYTPELRCVNVTHQIHLNKHAKLRETTDTLIVSCYSFYS